MKKNTKLYNLIFPPYFLMFFIPWLAALSIAGNFIIDLLVLIIISFVIFKRFDKAFYIRNIFKVWLIGFAADLVGTFYLFQGSNIGYNYINSVEQSDNSFIYNLMDGMNGVTNHPDVVTVYSVCFILSAILIASIVIFLLDYFIVFKKADMTKKQKVMSALSFAVFTAPYTSLLPFELFY